MGKSRRSEKSIVDDQTLQIDKGMDLRTLVQRYTTKSSIVNTIG